MQSTQAVVRIPFSAIRFSTQESQEWNVQFYRDNHRLREDSYWNEIDPEVNGFTTQFGKMDGIDGIKSPVRLSVTPYITSYLDVADIDGNSETSTAYTAGMDLKYGINDAFTLDMTLIPDFGQVISNNQVLNLSPFETFFSENRQFFTEGIEIFNKGNIFHSRRIGGRPFYLPEVINNLKEGEYLTDIPDQVSLYNATKISGRTQAGTGIGELNAVAAREYGVLNGEGFEARSILVNPLTNYNVLVVDQNLPNNSYFSISNANVMREGNAYDANTTATEFNIKTKNQKWGLSGHGAVSQQFFQPEKNVGHTYSLGLRKLSGKWNYGLSYSEESHDYNPNDLGFLFSPNERGVSSYIEFNEYNPGGNLNLYRFELDVDYNRLYKPDVFTGYDIDFEGFLVTKNKFATGFFTNFKPDESYNYFEPRTTDFSKYHTTPARYFFDVFISSDYRKTLALDLGVQMTLFDQENRTYYGINFSPRFRVNDKLFFNTNTCLRLRSDEEGFVNKSDHIINGVGVDDILFGRRNRTIIENNLSGRYIFSNKMGLTIRLRHLWDEVDYQSFGILGEDGYLNNIDYDGLDENGESIFNGNFNAFNLDLEYKWRFAPGSDMTFVWKNLVNSFDNVTTDTYFNNLGNLFDQDRLNI